MIFIHIIQIVYSLPLPVITSIQFSIPENFTAKKKSMIQQKLSIRTATLFQISNPNRIVSCISEFADFIYVHTLLHITKDSADKKIVITLAKVGNCFIFYTEFHAIIFTAKENKFHLIILRIKTSGVTLPYMYPREPIPTYSNIALFTFYSIPSSTIDNRRHILPKTIQTGQKK